MTDVRIRSTDKYFAEHLAEDMAREAWRVLARAAPPTLLHLGSYATLRLATYHFVRNSVRDTTHAGAARRTFLIRIGTDELDLFGLEAASVIVTSQEALCRHLDSVKRVSRAIAKKINAVLAPHYAGLSPASASGRDQQFKSKVRTVLAREATSASPSSG